MRQLLEKYTSFSFFTIAYNIAKPLSFNIDIGTMHLVFFSLVFPLLTVLFIFLAHTGALYIKPLFQMGKFVLVGILNTLVDISIFSILVVLIQEAFGYAFIFAKVVSFIGALANSYMWNKYWVFKREGARVDVASLGEVSTFLILSLGGLLVNLTAFVIASLIIESISSLPTVVIGTSSALVAAVASFTWNYIGYKFLVFKN